MTDIERARSACADAHAKVGLAGMAASFVNGLYDDSTDVQAALAGLQAERRRIVEWLRAEAKTMRVNSAQAHAVGYYASAIERSDHAAQ